MGSTKVNWDKVEKDYIEGNETYRQIAARYGVSENTVTVYGSQGKWADKRKQFRGGQTRRNAPRRYASTATVPASHLTEDLAKMDAAIANLDTAITQGQAEPKSLESCATALAKLVQVREEIRWQYLTVEGIANQCVQAGISPTLLLEKLKEMYEGQFNDGSAEEQSN